MDLVSLNSERILEALKLSKMHLQEMSRGNHKVRKKLKVIKTFRIHANNKTNQTKISAITIKVRKKIKVLYIWKSKSNFALIKINKPINTDFRVAANT